MRYSRKRHIYICVQNIKYICVYTCETVCKCVHVFQTEAFPSFTSAHFQSHAVSPCSCQVPSEPPSTYKKLLTHTQTQSMGLYARCINTKGDRKAIDCRNCQNTSHTFELACANFAFCTKLISDR